MCSSTCASSFASTLVDNTSSIDSMQHHIDTAEKKQIH
jgi:hypothetical protein